MGIDVERVSGASNVAREIAEMNKISSQIQKTEEEKKKDKIAKQQEKKEAPDAHLDTYKKNTVSNSIEQQIKAQKAKIEELSNNLKGIKQEYQETGAAEDAARKLRAEKERDLYKKEISEHSLQRLFKSWKAKYFATKDNAKLEDGYHASEANYDAALEERIHAERDYDMADADAFSAICKHNSADAAYISGLWSKESAYWDLARLQRNYMVAKIKESLND